MKMVSSLWLLVAPSSAAASPSRGTIVSPMAICPSALMVTNTGLSGRGCSGAVLAGRLTPISTVASGAATMKMISSTRMTSMKGVTLISCWISRSSPPERVPRRTAMALLRGPQPGHAMAAADHQKQLGRGIAEQRLVAADHPRQMIVDHDRRDRGDQTDCGGEQRLGNAGRDHCKIGGVGFGDADEGVHDAPHRSEEADKGCGGANGRENAGPARHLPRHRRLHPFQPQ